MRNKKYYTDFKLSIESDNVDTVIGSSVTINGPITSKKDMKIEGKVNGNITTNGSVFIGSDSIIDGSVKAKHVTVCGKVKGDVTAKGRIIITSKASILGNLSMENLVVDEGGVFVGQSSMGLSEAVRPVNLVKSLRPKEAVSNNETDEYNDSVVIEYEEK